MMCKEEPVSKGLDGKPFDFSTSIGVSHFLCALVNSAPPDAAMLPVDGAMTEFRASVPFPKPMRESKIVRYRVIVENIYD